jgi:hypothetical protein
MGTWRIFSKSLKSRVNSGSDRVTYVAPAVLLGAFSFGPAMFLGWGLLGGGWWC